MTPVDLGGVAQGKVEDASRRDRENATTNREREASTRPSALGRRTRRA